MTLKTSQDFPGGPVVKILHFHCRGHAESILINAKGKYELQYKNTALVFWDVTTCPGEKKSLKILH